jgi:hypothetical protein
MGKEVVNSLNHLGSGQICSNTLFRRKEALDLSRVFHLSLFYRRYFIGCVFRQVFSGLSLSSM